MYRLKIDKFFKASCLMLAAAALAACRSGVDGELDAAGAGALTLRLAVGTTTRATHDSAGERNHNEDTFDALDVFFYETSAGDDTAAILHERVTVDGNTARIPLSQLTGDIRNKSYKVYAVANYYDGSLRDDLSLNGLKNVVTRADAKYDGDDAVRAFRSENVPKDFVMTNFAAPLTITFNEQNEASGTLSLKRVAAKIRVALNVVPTIADGERTWKANPDDMRLFIMNGVRTARLDGTLPSSDGDFTLADDVDDYTKSDYYNILTSGSRETEDYTYSRPLVYHSSNTLTGTADPDYLYYNDKPFYTYPNSWSGTPVESHGTQLIIVVPWECTEGENTVYSPTYYTVPVNSKGEIVSNAYYYLRIHIGMKGSDTPQTPLALDAECTIADWGIAEPTEVDLRPLRFLTMNQTSFTFFNRNEVTIPFNSTHDCEVVGFKGRFFLYSKNDGEETIRNFDNTTGYGNSTTPAKGKIWDYEIDNVSKTLTFTHDFFNIWAIYPNSSALETNVRYFYDRTNRAENGTYHRLYSKFEVEITIQHSTGESIDSSYNETVYLTLYPSVYIDTELIDGTGSRYGSGWVLINGYGTSNTSTGGLGTVTTSGAGSRALTTVTITVLDDDQSEKWCLGDPRTYYINNELDNTSTQVDDADHTQQWTANGGAYDGTQSGRGNSNGCYTIWDYYDGPDWTITWSQGVWDAKNDNGPRTLEYYYPTSELLEKENVIAPKFMITSHHGLSGTISREAARRRCASFQQYGYPAGRWRLPTLAEVGYVKMLQAKDIIDDVFVAAGVWCGTGRTTNGETVTRTTSGTAAVRCVYDSWYWEMVDADGSTREDRIPYVGDIPESGPTSTNRELWNLFTWGDRPKENPQASKYTVEEFLRRHDEQQGPAMEDRFNKMDVR